MEIKAGTTIVAMSSNFRFNLSLVEMFESKTLISQAIWKKL